MISRNIVSSIYKSISRSILKYANMFSPASISKVLQYTLDSETPYTSSTLNGISVLSSLEDSDSYRFPLKGRAWLFDGTNDYGTSGARVTSGSVTNLTVCGWVKTTSTTDATLIGESNFNANSRSWALQTVAINPGKLRFLTNATGDPSTNHSIDTVTSINTGAWVHIACVFDGSQAIAANRSKIYINGTLASVTTTLGTGNTSLFNSTGHFGIGAASVNTTPIQFFSGSLSDIRIYSVAKSADEVLAIYNQANTPYTIDTTGLLAHYWCNEEAGTTGFDSSGNDNHLTLTNITPATFHAVDQGVVYNPANNVGYSHLAFFDGVNDYINTGLPINLSGQTITLDCKFMVFTSPSAIFAQGANVSGYQIAVNSPGNRVSIVLKQAGSSNVHYDVSTPIGSIVPGMFYEMQAVLDYSGANPIVTVSLNGISQTLTVNTAKTGVYGDYVGNGTIGARDNGASSFMSGFIYDFSVANGINSYTATGYAPSSFAGTVNGSPATVVIPQDESDTTKAINGSLLQFTGQAPYPATIESPCGTFDGTNDWAIYSSRVTSGGVTNLTVCALARFTGNNSYNIASEWRSDTLQRSWAIGLNITQPGRLQVTVSNDGAIGVQKRYFAVGTINDNVWHHIAFTFAPNDLKLYVDGALVSVDKTVDNTVNSLFNTNQPFRLGAHPDSGGAPVEAFPGQLSDVRVYSVTKSDAEVRAIANGNPDLTGLLAWYPLQEGGGLISYDISGNNNHLTLTNITESTFWANRNGGKTQDVAMLYGGRLTTQNLLTYSEQMNTGWIAAALGGAGFPVVSANIVAAPDGTTTADRIVYPSVPNVNEVSVIYIQATLVDTLTHTFSVYLRGDVGGESLAIMYTSTALTFTTEIVTLTTSWQRFDLPFVSSTGGNDFIQIGTDRRDGSQPATPAQTIYVWGAQLEARPSMSDYQPTFATSIAPGIFVPALTDGSKCANNRPITLSAGKFSNPYSRLNHDPYDAAEYNPLAIPSYESLPCITGNGSDNYVDLGSPLIPATADFEMSLWYYHVTNDTTRRELFSQRVTGGSGRLSFSVNTGASGAGTAGSIYIFINGSSNVDFAIPSSLTAASWHKITLNRTGNVFTVTSAALGGNVVIGSQTVSGISIYQARNTWLLASEVGLPFYCTGRIAYFTITTGGVTKEIPLTAGSGADLTLYTDGVESTLSAAIKGTLTSVWANTTDARIPSTDNAFRAIKPINTKFRRTDTDGDDRFVILRSAATGQDLTNLIEYTS